MIRNFENQKKQKKSSSSKKENDDILNNNMGNLNFNDPMDMNYVVDKKKQRINDPEKKDPYVWDPPDKSIINIFNAI